MQPTTSRIKQINNSLVRACLLSTYLKVGKLNTALIKPMYGDASGVRGAARLGRKINY